VTAKTKTLWTFAITSVALFMVVLDNLVVSTALPVIRTDLDASIEQLEWTVNADNFETLSCNTPFTGRKLKGRAVRTIVRGETVWAL